MRKTLRRALTVGALALALSSFADQAFAATQVYTIDGTLNGRTTRLYNDYANVQAGHDGWCYWGISHPSDYACTVNTTTDTRPLEIRIWAGTLKTAYGNKTVYPTPPSNNPGLMPLCMPISWVEGLKPHKDVHTSNIYYCDFWYN
jgi:hypothetical protein